MFQVADQWNEARYIVIEDKIDGVFTKFNNNADFVNQKCKCSTAQTFSHFSYYLSKERYMVTDIQGASNPTKTGYNLTDAAVHSTSRHFGSSDLSTRGIEAFLSSHACNPICRSLGIPISPLQKQRTVIEFGATVPVTDSERIYPF